MDELLQEFIAETRETLGAIAGEIVVWETAPEDRARLDAIFRFVHTVKGSCGFLDLPRLGRLSHAAEDALAAVRDGGRIADSALVSGVLAIIDRIGELVEAIDAGTALEDDTDDMLVAALDPAAIPVKPAAAGHHAAGPAAAPIGVAPATPGRTVRLGVDLLDRMMSGMSEMVLARNELARRIRDAAVEGLIDSALDRLSATVADLRDTVTRTRMQRIDALFSALPRLVRDTAAEVGKSVQLVIDGADVELDREMIEMIRVPLSHIIRNAIDHGIEAPVDRRAAGKRDIGRLTVVARQSGNRILIEVGDDGGGIDVARVADKAVAAGAVTRDAVSRMTEQDRLGLIFLPGISSRDVATAISGRGVGMDVVRANVEQIGGRVDLANDPGRGLTITIQVPLTLSIISTIILGVGDQRFAISRQSVEEIVTLRAEAVRVEAIGGATVAVVRGERMPLVALGHQLGLDDDRWGGSTLAILSTRDGHYALAVDAVLDAEELVVKPAAPAVMATGLYAGQTLPDNGRPMLLLDSAGIAIAAGLRFDVAARRVEAIAPADDEPRPEALLFEDFDGQRRLVPIALIDRIETIAAHAIRHVGGTLRLATGADTTSVHATAPFGDRTSLTLLRLADGVREAVYAIVEPIDIVRLPPAIAPPVAGSRAAGVAVIDGEMVELIDALAVFAGATVASDERPLCLLADGSDGWLATFLHPVLTAAGYRCVTDAGRDIPAVVLSCGDEVPASGSAPVVRLHKDPVVDGDARVCRYDRAAVLDAVAIAVAGGRS